MSQVLKRVKRLFNQQRKLNARNAVADEKTALRFKEVGHDRLPTATEIIDRMCPPTRYDLWLRFVYRWQARLEELCWKLTHRA